MRFRTFAVIGVALVLASGGAWATSVQGSNHNSASVQTASASSGGQSAPAQQAPAQPVASQPAQQAGVTKPVKVYWFLSGR